MGITAFAAEARVVIGQVATGDKEGEIKAARSLLGLIDISGALVTGDALHCQGETAWLINQRGGDWLFTLKRNRPEQHDEVAAWFADPQNRPASEHVTADADHGRVELRRHCVSHDIGWMFSDRRPPDETAMPGLATMATSYAPPDPIFLSAANGSAQDGTTSSPDPSSAKCDSPGRRWRAACPLVW